MDVHEIQSAVLGLTRRITVWLPPGFRMRGPRR